MGYSQPADRLEEITPSKIRVIFDRAAQLEGAGARILHFEIGRPDFDTPQPVKDAATRALNAGRVHYGPNAGTPELRKAVADHLEETLGVDYRPEDEILVTIGANEAVFLAIMAFCNPGDEIIIPVPAWPAYEACARLAGATPIFLPLKQENGYRLDPEDLAKLLTPRTKMVVLCTPHNPTGAVLQEQEIEQLAAILEPTDALVLSDEIYSQLVYGSTAHTSPVSVDALKPRTLLVNGFAKAYAMDGWRLGWLAGPKNLIGPALQTRQFTTTCPPTFVQDAAVSALTDTTEHRAAMREEFAGRRRAALSLLADQDLISVGEAQGAFYLYLTYPQALGPADEVAMHLLETEHVAVVPGSAFDPTDGGRYSLRFSYASSFDDVVEGMKRLIRFVTTHTVDQPS